MKILVIGSGGREHTLAWKLIQSPRVEQVFVAPGNGGTAADPAMENVPLPSSDFDAVIAFCRERGVDLVVVGPEAPLADGMADALSAAGLRCFGPCAAAARLESSKAFARDFMERHGIPSARYRVVTDIDEALRHLKEVDYEVVIKASGLAAGKGVIVPESEAEAEQALRRILVEREFGEAGDEVLIEERLFGEEASVLAFCDGAHLAVMAAAQDHKRALDGDQGPNTGGMGAYAPAPLITPALLDTIHETVLSRTAAGLRADGVPYVGVLYAGLMITEQGPRMLEYNCRFGDPETQVVLPLLDGDLAEIMAACVDGTLSSVDLAQHPGAAATVVAAAGGYPGSYQKGLKISGLEQAAALEGVTIFHAGTKLATEEGHTTSGGRVLAVTAVGRDLRAALSRSYQAMERIYFDGLHYRRDIGAKSGALN